MMDEWTVQSLSRNKLLEAERVQHQEGDSGTRLIPLVDWSRYHPWPPLGGLRHMVFHGNKTGFSKVVRKCGRRILIDERKFFEFVNEQTNGAK